MDKEYIILNQIESNSSITQRELSKKTQLSLGSVNVLINQMVHEGLIKLKHIPMNRALYMLTPKGMAEKAKKTREYIKYHYNYIQQTKDTIEQILHVIINEKKEVYIVVENDEIGQLLKVTAQNVKGCIFVHGYDFPKNIPIIVSNNETCMNIKSKGYDVTNILEKI